LPEGWKTTKLGVEDDERHDPRHRKING